MTTETTLNVRIAEDVKIKASKILQASSLSEESCEVEPRRIELLTSCLQSRRSTN